MSDSILNTTKKALGIGPDLTAFDPDITMHINSVFSTLAQLGIGPSTGFMIDDADAQWSDFLGEDLQLNSVKTYMHLRIRMIFDPPSNPSIISAFKDQIQELEWRLNAHREETAWVDPLPVPVPPYDPFED